MGHSLLLSSIEQGVCLVLSLTLGVVLGPGVLGFAETTEVQWTGAWVLLAV